MNSAVHTTPIAVAMANASGRSAKSATKKSKDNMYTLDWWKIYLDSYTTYHSFFAKEFHTDIQDSDTTLTGSCNAGITVTNTMVWWGEF